MGKALLGARLPVNLIAELRSFCKPRGILINHFVAKAVIERLKEEKEDEEDILTIEARKNELSMSETEWNGYLKGRGISV